ncbi:hypothetical protein BD289DRAFT_218164 [Coniella lustricola]|uniref:Secreted protein n=1 Tax=Coniella lustricola TaxID=2025994 RepID=A0A2T3ALI2_9PEZI|nr:hypothetical protein BD289DRAFT_218164 [Coniella lustricola]
MNHGSTVSRLTLLYVLCPVCESQCMPDISNSSPSTKKHRYSGSHNSCLAVCAFLCAIYVSIAPRKRKKNQPRFRNALMRMRKQAKKCSAAGVHVAIEQILRSKAWPSFPTVLVLKNV